MVFKRKKRPEISKPTNFQHVRKTYFDIHSQTLKDLPPQWTSILTDEDITRTAIAAHERHRHYHQGSYQQSRPKPFIGDACFLTPSDLEYLKSQTIVRGSGPSQQVQNTLPTSRTLEEFSPPIQLPRNPHLDRLYNVKSPDPATENNFPVQRRPSVPMYQNDLILPSNGKAQQAMSPAPVTTREKIDGNTKLSLEDVGHE